MSETPFTVDPADAASGERHISEATARFSAVRIDGVGESFEEAYGALNSYFGPKDELELYEVLVRWMREPVVEGAIQIRYRLLAWRERDTGALAAVRDCFVGVDSARSHCIVLLSHSLVLPAFRRTGVAGLVRTAPATVARQDLSSSGLDPRGVVLLGAEMEPVVPADLGSIVRLLSYGRAGFGVIPPEVVPYCQPDFRALAPGQTPKPIPMPLVVRLVGAESRHAIPSALADAMIEQFALTHLRSSEPNHVRALAASDRAQIAATGAAEIPLVVLPTEPSELDRLRPLLRSAALPFYPEPFRTDLPDEADERLALSEAMHLLEQR